MSKFLCVNFNRYVTSESVQKVLEGESGKEVCVKYFKEDCSEEEMVEDGVYDHINESYVQVNETFGCIEGEENDILIYKID